MKPVDTNSILGRVMALHNRSLPMYLSNTTPWSGRGRGAEAREVLEAIVADQRDTVDRLGAFIVENGGDVRDGEFPMAFTSLHDLSADYLIKKMLEHQRRDVQFLEQAVASLERAPMARGLVEQALGAAKAHCDAMEELVAAGKA